VLRREARKEFEQARAEKDPLIIARLLVVGRDCVMQTQYKVRAPRWTGGEGRREGGRKEGERLDRSWAEKRLTSEPTYFLYYCLHCFARTVRHDPAKDQRKSGQDSNTVKRVLGFRLGNEILKILGRASGLALCSQRD
jgi:hypothetical protein